MEDLELNIFLTNVLKQGIKEIVFIISIKKRMIKKYFYSDQFYKNIIKKKKDPRIVNEYKKILKYKKKIKFVFKIFQKAQVMLFLKHKNILKINIF